LKTGDPTAAEPEDPSGRRIDTWQALFMLPRSIWLPILAMGAIAVGTFFFNEWTVKSNLAGAEEIANLTEMQTTLLELRAVVTDAETGARGFLLSQDRQYLEPFENALAQVAVVGGRLRGLMGSDSALLARARRIESLRGQLIGELRATVILAERGQEPIALLEASKGDGRILMASLRQEVQGLMTELSRRVVTLRADAERSIQRSRLAAALLAVLTLGLLVLAVRLLVKDFWRQEGRRADLARERLRLEELVRDRTSELSDLSSYLLAVTEQEKAELARNLHDELGGLLIAAKMDLAWLQGRASAREPEARAKLDMLAAGLDDAMDVKRRVVENLRPALLDHFGLPTALQSYFEETCAKAGLNCKTEIPDTLEKIPQESAIAMFRVGQEALTNIIRHAHAKNVLLVVDADDDNYRIRISDDGIGMDPEQLVGAMSHGMLGMRHRIETLKGKIEIGTNEGHGINIQVQVPRDRAALPQQDQNS
jgi:signal transduction histidine kinase